MEFIVFRWVLIASDLPRLQQNDGGILKYEAGQTGVYRKHDDIAAEFRINSNGWNSRHSSYFAKKTKGKAKICIIGDSYVEALQVDYDKSFAEVLERELDPNRVDVYRFGLSGSPLSQYLYILEKEVINYQPEVVIINLVHNDFLESVQSTGGTYDASLAKYYSSGDGGLDIQEPAPYKRLPSWWIKNTATFRYLWVRKEMRLAKLRRLWINLFETKRDTPQYAGNILVSQSSDERINEVVDYSFKRLAELRTKYGFQLVIVIDGDRAEIMSAINQGHQTSSKVSNINNSVVTIAKSNNIEIIDLTPIFVNDYQKTKIRLNFESDGHWSEHAHKIVGKTLADKLARNRSFLSNSGD